MITLYSNIRGKILLLDYAPLTTELLPDTPGLLNPGWRARWQRAGVGQQRDLNEERSPSVRAGSVSRRQGPFLAWLQSTCNGSEMIANGMGWVTGWKYLLTNRKEAAVTRMTHHCWLKPKNCLSMANDGRQRIVSKKKRGVYVIRSRKLIIVATQQITLDTIGFFTSFDIF